jgi:hypothetical protein
MKARGGERRMPIKNRRIDVEAGRVRRRGVPVRYLIRLVGESGLLPPTLASRTSVSERSRRRCTFAAAEINVWLVCGAAKRRFAPTDATPIV